MTSVRASEVSNLKQELQHERAARDAAEEQAAKWRAETIDSKLGTLRTRREASAAREEVSEISRISRVSSERDKEQAVRLEAELQAVKAQREVLLKAMEDMQIPEEDQEGYQNLSVEERLKVEREGRHAAQALAGALRGMFDTGESERSALLKSMEVLQEENTRTKKLLAAAEDLLVQNRIFPSKTDVSAASSTRARMAEEDNSPGNNLIIPVGALVAVATIVTVAVFIYKRRAHH